MRGDYLSRLLHRSEIGWGLTLIGIAVAFGLGAVHAMSPGHGKTIVAAYLVGSRGTFKHAIFLGGMVTFTHTASVFLLGFVTLVPFEVRAAGNALPNPGYHFRIDHCLGWSGAVFPAAAQRARKSSSRSRSPPSRS